MIAEKLEPESKWKQGRPARQGGRVNDCPKCKELREALAAVMALIDQGKLVRNTSDDPNPDWGMRWIPFVMALAKAQKALELPAARRGGKEGM